MLKIYLNQLYARYKWKGNQDIDLPFEGMVFKLIMFLCKEYKMCTIEVGMRVGIKKVIDTLKIVCLDL